MEKLKTFFKNNKAYFITSGIVCAVFAIYLIVAGAWPFGSKTFIKYDGYFQTSQLFGHLFDVIEGNATFSYSNHLGGGSNIVGVVLYFFFNPFIFVALIGGRTNLLASTTIMYFMYFVTISIIFLYFLQKKFPNLKLHTKIMLACMYTFCAYTLCNQTIIVWLNFLIILPLLYLEFEKLIYQNKILGFSILTALCIYSSYAVGASMQIILIVLYFLFVKIILPKDQRRTACLNILMGLFCGLMMSLLVLVPCLLQLRYSCRLSADMGSIFNYMNFIYADDYSIPTNFMFTFMNSILTIIAIWSLAKSFRSNKTSRLLTFALIACSIPIIFTDISHFVAGGMYIHFSTRFFAINSFLLFTSAAHSFSISKAEPEIAICTKSHNKFMQYCFLTIFSIILVLVFLINFLGNGDALSIGESEWTNFWGYFLIPLTTISFFFVFYVFYRTKSVGKKFFNTLVIVIACVESFLSGMLILGSGSYQTETITAFHNITQDLPTSSRIKIEAQYLGNNSSVAAGVSSFSIFSSTAEDTSFKLSKFLGYSASIPNVSTQNGTLFSDLFLGHDYIVTEKDYSDRQYLSLEKTTGNLNLYKYNYTFKKAFLVNKLTDLDPEKTLFDRQNDLAKMLGATADIVSKQTYSVPQEITGSENGLDKKFKYYSMTFTAEKSGILYFVNNSGKIIIEVQNNNHQTIGKTHYGSIDMFMAQAGQTYSFCICIDKDKELNLKDIDLMVLDISALENLVTTTNQNAVDIEYTASGYVLDTSNIQNKNILVLQSNPLGMTFTSTNANSKLQTSTEIFGLTYLSNVDSEIVTASFEFPYTKITLIMGLGGIFIALVLIFINHKKRKWLLVLSPVALVIYYSVTAIVALYFFGVPSGISIIKYFCLIFL